MCVPMDMTHDQYLDYLRRTFTKEAMEKRQQLRLSGQLNAPIPRRKKRIGKA